MRKLNERQAWEKLARLMIDDGIHGIYDHGLCGKIDFGKIGHAVSPATAVKMKKKIHKALQAVSWDEVYLYPRDVTGLFQRVQFCLDQADKLKGVKRG